MGSIEAMYAFFEDADKRFLKALSIVDAKEDQSSIFVQELKAYLLLERAINGLKYSEHLKTPEKKQLITGKCEECINQSTRIYNQLGSSFNSEQARANLYMGQYLFKAEQYQEAIDEFTTGI